MREIKFRTWNGKKIVQVNKIDFDKMELDFEGVKSDRPNEIIIKLRPELMQFTGLKDKNGKDIYEGDILKAIYSKGYGKGNAWFEKSVVVEVEDSSYGYEFVYKTIKIVKRVTNKDLLKDWDMYSEFLVIGNRFENPELIKEDIQK